MPELKYKDITEKIIGASFEVHKFLGNGFQEVIYQRALAWELSQAGLSFAREIEQDIFYKKLIEPIGTRRGLCCRRKSIGRVESISRIGRCSSGSGIKLPEGIQT